MITDTEARKIAAQWKCDDNPAFKTFWSTGEIVCQHQGDDYCLNDEIIRESEREEDSTPDDYSDPQEQTVNLDGLTKLHEYVSHCRERGPITDWSK